LIKLHYHILKKRESLIRLHYYIVTIILLLCCTPSTDNAAETPSEYQIKAAYLYNFAKFIRWPESAFSDQSQPLVIGILGENYFDGELNPLNSRSVHSRPIEIRYFRTLKEVETCHMLYISTYEYTERASILKGLQNRPVVTVGESPQFADSGGVIQFVMIQRRLRFIINLDAAKNHQIQIDSQLLSLATEVLEAAR